MTFPTSDVKNAIPGKEAEFLELQEFLAQRRAARQQLKVWEQAEKVVNFVSAEQIAANQAITTRQYRVDHVKESESDRTATGRP